MGGALSIARNGLNQSFNIAAPTLTEKNIPDQSGKVFIITGANSGVGYNVTSILYGLNAKVYMACRTESKAQNAIKEIKKLHPTSTGQLIFLKLDLSDLSSIKSSAESFLAQETKLHWLDNNAGVMTPPAGSKGKQGHELQLVTNILGPFMFTQLLLPVLKSTAAAEQIKGSVRVSWAGSLAVDLLSPQGGVKFVKNQDGDMVAEDFGGGDKAYGTSKAANYILAREFGRRGTDSHGDGVLHNSFNPGNLKTNLQEHIANRPIIGPIAVATLGLILYPGKMGAYTELYAGLSSDLTIETDQGAYIIPWGRKATWNRHDVETNVGEGKGSEMLWDWCVRETKAYM